MAGLEAKMEVLDANLQARAAEAEQLQVPLTISLSTIHRMLQSKY